MDKLKKRMKKMNDISFHKLQLFLNEYMWRDNIYQIDFEKVINLLE